MTSPAAYRCLSLKAKHGSARPTVRWAAAACAVVIFCAALPLAAQDSGANQPTQSPQLRPGSLGAQQLGLGHGFARPRPAAPATTPNTQPAAAAQFAPNTAPGAAVRANLPATPVTASAPPTPAASVGTVTATAPTHDDRPKHAHVSYSDGQLTVDADNSSLNQILRSIENLLGMIITGGVPEQRVYGKYGPANPSQILVTLLDGTNTNILIREAANNRPSELILSVRNGGPTPPDPNATNYDGDTPDAGLPPGPTNGQGGPPPPIGFRGQAQPASLAQPAALAVQPANTTAAGQTQVPSTPPSVAAPLNNVLGNPNNQTPSASQLPTTNSQSIDSLPTPSTTVQTTQGIVDSVNPPPSNQINPLASPQPVVPPSNPNVSNTTTPLPGTTSTQTVPSPAGTDTSASTPDATGAKTPEQIMQELIKLQQQKQQQAAPQ